MKTHTAEVYNSSIMYNKTKVLKYICTLNWQHKVKYYVHYMSLTSPIIQIGEIMHAETIV